MKPSKKMMYDFLKITIMRLGGGTPILYFPQNKEHEAVYHYLAREGYITLSPCDGLTFYETGRTVKLPRQPIESVTEKGFDFVKEYESQWKTRIVWWCGVVIGLIGLIAAVLTIITFFSS